MSPGENVDAAAASPPTPMTLAAARLARLVTTDPAGGTATGYRRWWPYVASAMVAGGVLFTDLITAQGTAGALPYAALLFFGIWMPTARHILVLATLASALTLFSCLMVSANGAPWTVLGNHLLALLAIWLVGALLIERRRSSESLRKLSAAVEHSPVMVIITDADAVIEYINPRFSQLTGYTLEDVRGKRPSVWSHGQTPEAKYTGLWKAIEAGHEWRGEFLNRRRNGSLFWAATTICPIVGEAGRVTHYLGVIEDISLRKEQEQRLDQQAHFDALTGLPNRVLALDRLTQALAGSRRNDTSVAVIYLDLDRFKLVNDTLGHVVGDQLLVETAKRLAATVREDDTVARLGDDEFLIILQNLSTTKYCDMVIQKISKCLVEPFELMGNEVFVTSSIGVSIFPVDGDSPLDLLGYSDVAMNQAKDLGGDAIRYFRKEMNAHAQQRLDMDAQLRHALERGELVCHYQPIIDAKAGDLIGMEALIRWHNPILGQVPPDRFIPLAEETGLIVPVGAWVLSTACQAAAEWRDRIGRPLRVAVNVSSRQIREPNFLDTVKNALDAHRLAPECLELEVTERLLLADGPSTIATIAALIDLGVGLSIDDFGTGYSALTYLKTYPFKTLKIDRSFVSDVTTNREDASLTKAIISMAQGLGLEVIGEGVERADQLAFLAAEGCDMVQGFYFSRPLGSDECLDLIEGWTHDANAGPGRPCRHQ